MQCWAGTCSSGDPRRPVLSRRQEKFHLSWARSVKVRSAAQRLPALIDRGTGALAQASTDTAVSELDFTAQAHHPGWKYILWDLAACERLLEDRQVTVFRLL